MAGRKKATKPRVIEIRFRVNEDENAEIEALSGFYQMNKSKLIRHVLLSGKTCVGCSNDYLIPNRDEDVYRIGDFSPDVCWDCSRNYCDRYKK